MNTDALDRSTDICKWASTHGENVDVSFKFHLFLFSVKYDAGKTGVRMGEEVVVERRGVN